MLREPDFPVLLLAWHTMHTPQDARRAEFLHAYDSQLRTDAETPSALKIKQLGPLRLVTFAGGRGFVTYADLGGAGKSTLQGWVREVLNHFGEDPALTRVEWKSRGHDAAPGLHDALLGNGFVPDDPESIMIGHSAGLVADIPLPAGVTLRRITGESDVRAMSAMQDTAFGDEVSESRANDVLHRLERDDGMELWVAEHHGSVVSAGRLEPVAGTDFAGLWGGATLEAWRGRGIYRALTAERARAALRLGKTLMHSDSTEFSRPILEAYGLIKVSTTTPYEWRR